MKLEKKIFAVFDEFLKVQSNFFGYAEILHAFRNGDAHFFAQAEKMVYGCTCCKDNGGVV